MYHVSHYTINDMSQRTVNTGNSQFKTWCKEYYCHLVALNGLCHLSQKKQISSFNSKCSLFTTDPPQEVCTKDLYKGHRQAIITQSTVRNTKNIRESHKKSENLYSIQKSRKVGHE